MIYTTNILAFPMILIVWALDAYLLLLLIYAIAGRLSGEHISRLRDHIKPFVDPVPLFIKRWLDRHISNPVKSWVPWAAVAFAGLIIRHLLVLIILWMR